MLTDRLSRNQKICRLYTSGLSLRQVAHEVDLTHETIRQVLKKSGISIRPRLVIADADYHRAVRLLRDGMPIAHLADKVGHGRHALVRRFKQDNYYQPQDRCEAWTAEEERMVRTWYGKRSARVIAEQIGRTRNEVIGKARRLGLSRPLVSEAAE